MNTPLSYSSLLTQADENWNRYKAEADARDAAFYGPGKLMRTVMRPIDQRLPPQWDAFMQALRNNGVQQMSNINRQTGQVYGSPVMGRTNQLGSVSGPEPQTAPSFAPFANLEGGPRVNMNARPAMPQPKKAKL